MICDHKSYFYKLTQLRGVTRGGMLGPLQDPVPGSITSKSNFQLQDTKKSVCQKSWEIIRLNVLNFFYIHVKSLLEWKKYKKPHIIRFLRKMYVFCFFFTLKVILHEYKKNWEHLNVFFPNFFVKHFFLYLEVENLTFISVSRIF